MTRGVSKVSWVFTFAPAAYDLVEMRTLFPPATQAAELGAEVRLDVQTKGAFKHR